MKVLRECRVCKLKAYTDKDLIKFVNNSTMKYSKANLCRECHSNRMKGWYHKNKDTHLPRTKKNYHRKPDSILNSHRKRKYGITTEEWNTLFVEQEGKCACCNTPITKSAHTDHNHKTGKIRGILCRDCNTGLGMFGDSPSRLQQAYNYLIREGYYGEH